jgi:hypothetical protein
MCHRLLRVVAVCFALCFAGAGQSQTMSVDKLIAFIQSSAKFIQAKQMTDSELAGYLAKVKLTERLDDRTIEDMQSAGGLGPKTILALKLLRDRTQSLSAANLKPPPKYVPPPPPSSEEQAAIITEVREYALNYSKSLPNYLCTEVMRRKAAGTPGSRYGGGSASEPSYQTMDTLTIRLSYYEQKEDYKLILINNAPTTQDYRTVGGATSTGEFGSLLRQIFEPGTEARFEWDHWGLLRGRRVMAFAYHVEQSRSQWEIEYEHKDHIIPAYSGLVEVDQDTHVVMRVTLVAENIPPSFPVRRAETKLDYDYQDISGHEFLLPLKSETLMTSDGILNKNETEFRFYRKYSAEAEIKYDITPDPLPDDKTKEVKETVNCKDPKNAKDPRCKP